MNRFIVKNLSALRDTLQPVLPDVSDVMLVGYVVDEPDAIKCTRSALPDVVTLNLRPQSEAEICVLENIKRRPANSIRGREKNFKLESGYMAAMPGLNRALGALI